MPHRGHRLNTERLRDTELPSRPTYTFQDVVDALDKIAPDDWAAFLNRHLHSHSVDEAIAGLPRAGWKLVYTDIPTETFRQDEEEAGDTNLDYSIGLQISAAGRIQSVRWDTPAFRAGLSPGSQVLEVNGQPFSTRALLAAVQSAGAIPLSMRVDINADMRVINIAYREKLRYPHLERVAGTPDRLSALLDAR